MIVINLSKNTIVCENIKEAKNFTDKLLGLLKKSNSSGLILKTKFGIHTFGLRDSIDVLVLDNKLVVKKLKINLLPNKFFFWNPRFFMVIELPKGTIKSSNTSMDDQIKIKET